MPRQVDPRLPEQNAKEALLQDSLLDLSTRDIFFEQAQRALAQSSRSEGCTALLSIDLDQFHRVNDNHGYGGGDEVLVIIAERLRTSLREHDMLARVTSTIARVGGDEYLLMCEGVRDAAAAATIAERLGAAVAVPIVLSSGEVVVTATIGIALSANDSGPEQSILDAEAAQRQAKGLGGARHQLFTEEHRKRVAAESAVVEALRHAVVANEFRLVYQPKISLENNRIFGVEALLRWDHPQNGLIMPGDFIPAAEQSGVVVQIGEWVLRAACRQLAVWDEAYSTTPLQLAVNVSARQFRAGLAQTIRDAIDGAGIDAKNVCLEMTETTVMEDIDRTIGILDELKEFGFTISIDDFGTGYSSLEYLHRMPIDEVKIDRSFVAGLGSDSVNTAIVASVISLAHAMDLDVVAEGVETLEQLERLHSLGCDLAQGYFISRPITPSEIDELLATGQEIPARGPTGGGIRPSITETVLIIDDTADVRMLARMSLTAAGFTVAEGDNGANGLESARRLIPDCVLLDVNMPDMSGIDVCKELRSDPATTGCTIVMLTTLANPADKAAAFLVGADDYIVKPFTPRELVGRVRAAVHRRKTTISAVGRQVDAALLEMLHTARERDLSEDTLTDADNLSSRQIEIVRRLLGGQRVPSIARDLYLSQSTVRNHLSAIYQRVGVNSQEKLLDLLRSRSSKISTPG